LPIVLTEEKAIPIVKASCNSIGLNISDVGEVRKEAHSTAILAFPIDEGQALDESKELLDEFNPVALLAIEKAGRNGMGVYHSAYGSDISSAVAKIDLLVEEAETRKIPTIGIGDVGNEVGMGNIVEKVRSHIPFALECKCPCQGGTSSTTKVDILTVASVSNWGAYAIEACVSAMLGNLDTMHTGEMEKRCIRACVAAGAIDAMNKTAILRVDGISEEINADIVEILRAIVASELSRDS
jgi:hypothetical protein